MPGLNIDTDGLDSGLDNFEARAEAVLKAYAAQSALKLQNDARENAPWTDRTGHARQRLTGDYSEVPEGYQLELAHGVDYGIWLELAHEKRFSIIPKTIEYTGTFEIIPGFERLLEGLR